MGYTPRTTAIISSLIFKGTPIADGGEASRGRGPDIKEAKSLLIDLEKQHRVK